jgi:hypothetical protein
MSKIREYLPQIVAATGVILAGLGLVALTLTDVTGLYCFAAGVVLLLVYIVFKTIELNRE